MARPMPASPQNSSSSATGSVSPVGSPMALAMKSNPYSPLRAASSTMGHGNSSRSSHSCAAGRTTFSAKSCTHFWICCWSSLRSSEKSAMPRKLPMSNLRHNSPGGLRSGPAGQRRNSQSHDSKGDSRATSEPVPRHRPGRSGHRRAARRSRSRERVGAGERRRDRPRTHRPHARTGRNDTLHDLLECVTINGVRSHLEAFQRIADNNGGTRASGTPGFDRSLRLRASRSCRTPAIRPACSGSTSPSSSELSRPCSSRPRRRRGPSWRTPTSPPMDFSGSGDVTAPITPVDLLLPPVGGSTSGCEPADFAGLPGRQRRAHPARHVRLRRQGRQRGGGWRLGGDHLQRGQLLPDRTELLLGTLGEPGVTIPVLGTTFALGEDLAGGPATVRIDDRHVR